MIKSTLVTLASAILLLVACSGGGSSSSNNTSLSCYDPQTQICFTFTGATSFNQQCVVELCPVQIVSSCPASHTGTPVSTCTHSMGAAIANCPAGTYDKSFFVAPSSVGDNTAMAQCQAQSGTWSGPQ